MPACVHAGAVCLQDEIPEMALLSEEGRGTRIFPIPEELCHFVYS